MRTLALVLLLSCSAPMDDFDFQKAEEFVNLIDSSEESSPDIPAFGLLDREFVEVTKTAKLKDSYLSMLNSFMELNTITFIRYKNEALFITRGTQESGEGYVLQVEKEYEILVNVVDHYKILNEVDIKANWRQVKFKKLQFNE